MATLRMVDGRKGNESILKSSRTSAVFAIVPKDHFRRCPKNARGYEPSKVPSVIHLSAAQKAHDQQLRGVQKRLVHLTRPVDLFVHQICSMEGSGPLDSEDVVELCTAFANLMHEQLVRIGQAEEGENGAGEWRGQTDFKHVVVVSLVAISPFYAAIAGVPAMLVICLASSSLHDAMNPKSLACGLSMVNPRVRGRVRDTAAAAAGRINAIRMNNLRSAQGANYKPDNLDIVEPSKLQEEIKSIQAITNAFNPRQPQYHQQRNGN
ncbi:hypothetical protein B0O80DRAFT_492466 [Mortierella sp. GBAus27b]|nr:hypothetical protein B0O80DRAFT_492466 [Mortierella sp. GBAus27b]